MSRLPIRILTIAKALTSLPFAAVSPRRRPSVVRRILIAHDLLLGDTILLAPLLKKLRGAYPEAEVTVLVKPAFLVLFQGRPYGAKAMAFSRRDPQSQAEVLRSGPYDLAIVPDDNRYAWLARAAGAKWVIGFANDRPAWKNWMPDEAVAYPSEPAAWADTAAGLIAGPEPEAFQPGEWPAPPAQAFAQPARAYAVLHVGASTPLKLWPPERWRALADRLREQGLLIVWSGGPGEGNILDAIGLHSDEINLIGQLDLAQLWALLSRAQLLVCPDTGIAHLARIVGVPAVALFGPGSSTIHGTGRFWRDAPFKIVTVPDFPCRDQRVLFRRELDWVRRCGRGYGSGEGQCAEPLCMQAIELDKVTQEVTRMTLRNSD